MRFITPDAAALAPATLSDDELMAAQRSLAAARNVLISAEALVAAEIGRRSSRDLGYSGLAAKHGARSPEQLVQTLTGGSLGEARRLVRIGTVVESAAADEPWLVPALDLPVAALDSIRAGLGRPNSAVTPGALAAAAQALASVAPTVDIDALARLARQARAELDVTGVPLREQELFDQRDLVISRMPNGMTKLIAILNPESDAIVRGAIDKVTAPRRGGPRFVDPSEPTVGDDRTVGQMMLDALVDIVSVAMKAPSGRLFGKQQPGVRVLVTLDDLNNGEGIAYIEGQSEPASIETARRYACEAGVLPVLFDKNGRGMDLGRTRRLHDTRQRDLAASRDGGCLVPGCPCPPAWCEMHHIVPWQEGGGTSVDDGVLLCRFHHMMVHNSGGRIVRKGTEYYLIPPKSLSTERVPVPLPSKSPALRRLLAEV